MSCVIVNGIIWLILSNCQESNDVGEALIGYVLLFYLFCIEV
jgi:hypothetical protein